MQKFMEKIGLKRTQGRLTKEQSTQDSSNRFDISEDIGLKLICENTQCDVDLVAIHGDGGHYERSWSHSETKVFWLRDLLPSIVPKSRVLSFGYPRSKSPLSKMSTPEIAFLLLQELSRLREHTKSEKRKIIFLAHSFGVLILKGALINSSALGYNDIFVSTVGVMFFGSHPDVGQGLGSLASSSFPDDTLQSPQVAALRKEAEWLQTASSQFSAIEKQGEFKIVYFLESPTDGPMDSLSQNLQEQQEQQEQKILVIRMKKSHGMMIRFRNASDDDFRQVEKLITQIYNNQV
ncbi:hypothetical protein BGW36DRAFT_368293 [Talaromyces proteolyticus]|uniref:DUF676 domain-containing protein n=1 Tax=Talaromyces proteolyticus TaxID=1131652 RepID=A0AAD4Q707_9EURO|nr:uncharacterized protein BGW36DRAFT_368293 [Talaromyces proteolyticus]KAH8705867.1 hypothetical protein BGW36DRAFT_368293 [Talaromyces proteolyticus]